MTELIKLILGIALNIEIMSNGFQVTQLGLHPVTSQWQLIKKTVYQDSYVFMHDLADAFEAGLTQEDEEKVKEEST